MIVPLTGLQYFVEEVNDLDLKDKIRIIPDFPKPGISFKDITTLFKDGPAFRYAIEQLAERCRGLGADLIVCPEARGFLVGAPLALALGLGVVLLRKPGKLPGAVMQYQYQLEYGTDALEVHRDDLAPGQKLIVVDDLLATGGTVAACINLVEQLGAKVLAAAFLMELIELGGRAKLDPHQVISLVQYDY